MCGGFLAAISVIKNVATILGAAKSIGLLDGGGGGGKAQAAPSAPPPAKVEPELTKFKKPGPLGDAPAYLKMSSSMTPLQQRSAIATGGVSGDTGVWRDPAVVDYYKNLALSSLVDESGSPMGEPLPIEQQYLEQVLGQTPRSSGTGGFLNALMRS